MLKVQNQSPYIPHNNQLVHPFARQLSTKWITTTYTLFSNLSYFVVQYGWSHRATNQKK